MRKIKEVLRLTFDKKMSQHKIAKSLSLSSGVINKYLQRFKDSGLLWPLPPEMSDTTLQAKLKAAAPPTPKAETSQIDFPKVRQELGRKHVTLQLLYVELGGEAGLGLSYSQFCRRYQDWQKRIKPSMRQIHRPGDKAFVDYAGTTIEILSEDGEILQAQIFVGILGASNYTYAEATLSQSLPDWIGSHVRMFEFFGGVPDMVVPDNLKSGIKKTCRYEPDINPAYAQMIEYYSSSCMPARPYTPKDKAKVENAVGIISRWIIARLRNETFIGLAQLNRRIAELLEDLNHRPFKKLPGCRHSAFVELDQPVLKALPLNPYEFKEYKKARVNIDYHIELDGHYYSLPYRFVKKEVEVWFSRNMVDCYFAGELLVKHVRSYVKGQHSTRREHMPEGHRAYSDWSPERFKTWALSIGPSTGKVIEALLISRPHIEQAYRSCMGVLGLAKKHSPMRLESACQYALKHRLLRYKQIKTVLETNLDLKKSFVPQTMPLPFDHANVRGSQYYH
jgi:transposase